MGKTISDEKIKLSIIIDGNQGQKELFDLEKATRKLNEENKALGLQKKLLIKQGKEETEEFKNLTDAIKANNKEIATNKTKMKELQDQIGITGLTMHQLTEKARLLRLQLNNAIPGGEAHRRYSDELNQVNTRLSELRGNSNNARMSLGSLADSFNRYQGIAISVIAALTGIVLSIQKIIDINGKLSDAQSNVMKTTGMTKQEVDELTKSFGLLETRSSRIDLLGIAEQGGRIGIAKAEIGDFVNVMNKASVSLGDSFTGGAEEVANKLGKIKFLFQETKDIGVDQAYNAIGSAINDLGANGTASEANIADFTTRIGSLTDVLKPTIQETLALGTAFEESGIESEVSARAYGIFMKQASTETAKFAQVMGLTQKQVETMVNDNPLEFMLKFSEGMKGMSGTETAKTLDFLGISADGANKVIGAMGNNTARFRELMVLSNNSFREGTSLVNEYDIKNNNLAATLEKISKTVSGWFSSETFVKWLTVGVDWLAKFIGATEDVEGSTSAWKNTLVFTAKVIAIITAAMVTNVGWQKLIALWTTRNAEATTLYNIAVRARAFADGVAMVASQAYAAVTMLLSGNIRGAQQAFRAMTATMMTTPWGFIIGAIAAVGAAYVLFSKEASDAAKIQKTLADVHLEASKNIAKEKSEIDLLTKIGQSENIEKDKKIKAIARLNEIIPDYIGILTLENIKTAEGIGILKKYTAELYANARAKAVQSKFDELSKEKVDIESKSSKDYQSKTGQFLSKITGQDTSLEFSNKKDIERYVLKNFTGQLNAKKDKTTGATIVNKELFETLVNRFMDDFGINDKEKELALKDAQMKSLEAELLKSTVNDLGKTPDPTKSNFNVPTGGTDDKKTKKDPNSTLAEINRLKLENEAKYADLLLKQQRQLEDDRIAAMEEGYTKEMAIEGLRYQREIDDLNRQKVHSSELAKLDEDIAKAKEAKDTTKYKALLVIRKGWDKKNLELDEQINEIKEGKLAIHNLKLATIEEKGAKDQIQKEKEAFDLAKTLREIKFNEELVALGNNEIAKAKLRKKFEENESVEQEKFLRHLIDEFNTIIGKGNFEQMDMSLLTPEQVTEFTKLAKEAGLTLAELIAKRNELTGNAGPSMSQALGLKGDTDMLGFSKENWEQFYQNLSDGKIGIEEMAFAVQALTNVWSQYGAYVTANENAQLQKFETASDAKKTKLKRQLDSGVISQKTYTKLTEKIDKDLDKKKAEIEYKQAKRQRAIAISNAITGTAVAVINALATQPVWLGIAMGALVGVMGGLQIATIMKTPLPAKGYESGLYGDYVKREQDGKVFKSRYAGKTRSGLVSDTSHFLVAENGPEMVIDNKAWRQMPPEVKDSLVGYLQGVKGWEQGKYNPELKRYEVPAASNTPAPSSSSNNDSQMMQMALAVISENTAVMKDLRDNGVFVTNKDLKSMKNLKEGIDAFNELRTKSKR
jgi:TP901 family phage tail tape measure protein